MVKMIQKESAREIFILSKSGEIFLIFIGKARNEGLKFFKCEREGERAYREFVKMDVWVKGGIYK